MVVLLLPLCYFIFRMSLNLCIEWVIQYTLVLKLNLLNWLHLKVRSAWLLHNAHNEMPSTAPQIPVLYTVWEMNWELSLLLQLNSEWWPTTVWFNCSAGQFKTSEFSKIYICCLQIVSLKTHQKLLWMSVIVKMEQLIAWNFEQDHQ